VITPRKALTVIALAALVAASALSAAAPAASGMSRRERRALHLCGTPPTRHPQACILRAALHRGQSYAALRALAYCESRNQRFARNPSGAAGPFQFMPSTWATTPYRSHSLYEWKWAALATAWMWSRGRRAEWAC
jgi:hypothetical protein